MTFAVGGIIETPGALSQEGLANANGCGGAASNYPPPLARAMTENAGFPRREGEDRLQVRKTRFGEPLTNLPRIVDIGTLQKFGDAA